MKHTFLSILGIFLTMGLFAQPSNLSVFSEANEPFVLMVEGKAMNQAAVSNVMVVGLDAGEYEIGISFGTEDVEPERFLVRLEAGREVTYALTRDREGEWELRFVHAFAIDYRPVPGTRPVVVAMSSTVEGSEGKLNLTIGKGDAPALAPNDSLPGFNPDAYDPVPGYTGRKGCEEPMFPTDYADVQQNIKSKTFSDTKLRIAKQVADNHCLLAAQVAGILDLLSFETDKLEFAKYAFPHTYDQDNYYKVYKALSYENSVEELKKHLGEE